MEQLALLEIEPTALPTPQQVVYDALHSCGNEGLTADEAGALAHSFKDSRWAHSAGERCQFCGRDGLAILKALETKGLAYYRRKKRNIPGAWLAVSSANATQNIHESIPEPFGKDGEWAAGERVPYGVIPF